VHRQQAARIRAQPPIRASTNTPLRRFKQHAAITRHELTAEGSYMDRIMLRRALRAAVVSGVVASLGACGGGGGSPASNSMSGVSSGNVSLMMSDASSDDWAIVGVRVLSVALIPQGGGANVTVWTAPGQAPYVNLEQLDQLSEILGNVSVPTGTYSGAVLTLSANPGDVLLTVAANPESGFPLAAGTVVPAGQIEIQGTSGSAGNATVAVTVNFADALNVTGGQNDALDLEFDLANPAFIVGHTPPAADGATIWAINFNGPVRPHRVHAVWNLVLRHMYGTVTSVDPANQFIDITKDYPLLPVTTPETAVPSSQSLTVDVDGTNGTIFYDVDAGTSTVIKDFSSVASTLPNKYVRIAARYQQDGSLIAVRIWASSSFDKVWLSPEGHVLHVDAANAQIVVQDESGAPVPVTIGANTQFFFRTPADALADATPIGTGPAFLASQNLVRGFKVHVSCVDPLAAQLTAQTIDIETAAFSGSISAAGNLSFMYTHNYVDSSDDYAVTVDYISNSTPNGEDGNNNAISGFKWWNFAYPAILNDGGTPAITSFMNTTNGGVAFGGSVGTLAAWGLSGARWADPANPGGWSVNEAVIMPTPMPLGTVTTAYANNSFAMTVAGGANPVTVDVSTTAGAATLVYQIERSAGIVTVMPVDVAMSGGVADLNNLIAGTPVKVYGVPQSDGTLLAYVIVFYTGMLPAS
jgi:hypothetical protein